MDRVGWYEGYHRRQLCYIWIRLWKPLWEMRYWTDKNSGTCYAGWPCQLLLLDFTERYGQYFRPHLHSCLKIGPRMNLLLILFIYCHVISLMQIEIFCSVLHIFMLHCCCYHGPQRNHVVTFWPTLLIRVSTTPGNTGNLLEFEIPPGNTGNLLEFCWCSWKKFTTSRFSGPLGLKWEFWGVKCWTPTNLFLLLGVLRLCQFLCI